MLGLLVAWLCLDLTQGPSAVVPPVVGLWLVAVPVFDLCITCGRRLAKHVSLFLADHQHSHDILRQAGFPRVYIVALMAGVSFALGTVGLVAHLGGVPEGYLFLGLVGMGCGYFLVLERLRSKGRRKFRIQSRRPS